jgi:3-phenylpropionate/cinnamic acid dioxygenase small subunit
MSRSEVLDPAAITAFLYREVRLLDTRHFDEWRDLFTEDGIYWAPTQPDQVSPDSAVSLFLDDKVTMAARIRRLAHPDVHVQMPPSRVVHMVGNIECAPEPDADGNLVVHATFVMAEYRSGPPIWYAGRYEYRLRPGPDLRIVLKKVVLLNCDAAFNAMAIYL